jgi:hypothetical protein
VTGRWRRRATACHLARPADRDRDEEVAVRAQRLPEVLRQDRRPEDPHAPRGEHLHLEPKAVDFSDREVKV